MSNQFDVIILGAGISGLLLAKEFAHANLEVCLIDKSKIGTESSWAGGGIISPLYPWRYPHAVNQLASWSQSLYPSLIQDIKQELDPEYVKSGMLVLDEEEKDAAMAWASQYQKKLIHLKQQQVQENFPKLQHHSGALWMPEVFQVRNPRLVKSLRHYLKTQTSVAIKENCSSEIIIRHGQVEGIQIQGEQWQASKIVLCAGAWTGRILQRLGIEIEVKPIKGQMLLYHVPKLCSTILLAGHRYIIPRKDGHILVGSTLEDVGFEKSTTEEAKQVLQKFAEKILPELKNQPIVKHWSGLRPASPQGIPFIGKIPNIKGLYINAGHFRNGVVLGPGAARLARQIILGQNCQLDPLLFSL